MRAYKVWWGIDKENVFAEIEVWCTGRLLALFCFGWATTLPQKF